ncbi:MAG: prepilin-type N-terminal cleavage/methylation domain-containing protein [Verrucomicrobiales bacterium]
MRVGRAKSGRAGYSLVEVLVSSAIMLIGISAVASLSLTSVTLEEMNFRISRAMNVQENYARLFMLGMDPADVVLLVPPDPVVNSIAFVSADVGNLESEVITMTIDSVIDAGGWSEGSWTGGSDSTPPQRQIVLRAFRPTTR